MMFYYRVDLGMTDATSQSLHKGLELLNNQKYSEAIPFFFKILESNQNDPEILYYLGYCYFHIGQDDRAITYLNKVLEIDDESFSAWNIKGLLLYKQGLFIDALNAFNRAIHLKSEDSEIWINIGQTFEKLCKNTEALNAYDQAINNDPKNADILFYKGLMLIKLQKYEDALVIFDDLIKYNTNSAELWNNKGIVLKKLSRFDEAVSQFEKAVKLDPTDPDYWFNLGTTQYQIGHVSEGITAIDEALRINPNDNQIKNYKNKITDRSSEKSFKGEDVKDQKLSTCIEKLLKPVNQSQQMLSKKLDEIVKKNKELEESVSKLHEHEKLIEFQKETLMLKEKEIQSAQTIAEKSTLEFNKKNKEIESERKELKQSINKIDEERKSIESQKVETEQIKMTLGFKEKEIVSKEKEIDKKEKDIEQIRQKWNEVDASRDESNSRVVKVGDVKVIEMNFIDRTEKKFGFPKNQIEIFGKTFIADQIFEDRASNIKEIISQIPQSRSHAKIENLPENRYLTVKLVEKNFLNWIFGKEQRYTFKALFLSRPHNYAEFGFDAKPLAIEDINPILIAARDEAIRLGETFFLCIASPTGFSSKFHTFTDGEEFYRNFLSQHLSICFLDLETSIIIVNPTDEIAKAFMPYCEMLFDNEKMYKIQHFLYPIINKQIQLTDYMEYWRGLKSCQDAGFKEEDLIKAVFYQYSAENGLKVRPVKDVGLVMMKHEFLKMGGSWIFFEIFLRFRNFCRNFFLFRKYL
jgi:tetratricopeptide (TPR) repeat protein